MQENNHRFRQLLNNWVNNPPTDSARNALLGEMKQVPGEDVLAEALQHIWEETKDEGGFTAERQQELINTILKRYPAGENVAEEGQGGLYGRKLQILRRWHWVAAACLIALAGIAIWKFRSPGKDTAPQLVQVREVDPGKQGAILILADGSQVLLDTFRNGVIALQGGITAKVADGALLYEGLGNEVLYNTITTPKSRQFHVTLPDNTQVWLNAGSSIRYPTLFADKERRVSVTGEAYFEVAKNAAQPFSVEVDGRMEVEVLGTHFNINAYDNEAAIRTTLVEGSVRVKSSATPQPQVMVPGQEAILERSGSKKPELKKLTPNEVDKALAWKNGGFNFEDVTLVEAMRQIERWYNIEVVITPGVPVDAPFDGQVSRNMSLNKLVRLFEKSELIFTISNDNKLIISK